MTPYPTEVSGPLQPLGSPEGTGPCFFPAMLPVWQGSSHDAQTSCWIPCRARGPWCTAPLGGRGRLYGPGPPKAYGTSIWGLRVGAPFPSSSSGGHLG